jgi:hypothetical protein
MRYGHFGGSSSRPFGEGGSRPPSVTRSDDEDDGGDDDGDDVEWSLLSETACSPLYACIAFVWPFVEIDDKGGEILIKASYVFHVLSFVDDH